MLAVMLSIGARTRFHSLIRRGLVLGIAVTLVGCAAPVTPAVSPSRAPTPIASAVPTGGQATPSPDASPSPARSTAPSPSPSPAPEVGTPQALYWRWSPSIQVYAGAVSVLPGQPIGLKVSTPAATYALSLALVTATGLRIVYQRAGLPGHDWHKLLRIDPVTHAVRARWPTAVTVPSTGYRPGIYIATATDSRGTTGHAIVVVRTPTLDPTKPAFVYDALTQAAYDGWGGWSFYSPLPALTVTFDRPLLVQGGLGIWPEHDSRLVMWLLGRRPDLQFTTDYDLGLAPPTTAPRTLILGFHTEYVPGPMHDWIVRHVETLGDMNLAVMGANAFYWRVRLGPSVTAGLPAEVTCYKLNRASDPLAATSPTGKYRDLGAPEGALLGGQYVGMVLGGRRFDSTITDQIPAELIAGTGWKAGTVLRGVIYGEADWAYPGSGSTMIAANSKVPNRNGGTVSSGMVIRIAASGGRVFDAGTFGIADGLPPSGINLGVNPGSFDRFMRNLLGWLGVPALR